MADMKLVSLYSKNVLTLVYRPSLAKIFFPPPVAIFVLHIPFTITCSHDEDRTFFWWLSLLSYYIATTATATSKTFVYFKILAIYR